MAPQGKNMFIIITEVNYMGQRSKSTINHKRLDVLRLFLTLILFSFISLGGYALHPFDELTGAESIDGSMLSTNTTGTDYYVSVSNSSALSMDVNAVASGTYASVKDTVTTRTNIGGIMTFMLAWGILIAIYTLRAIINLISLLLPLL